jgi:hypothetical protein
MAKANVRGATRRTKSGKRVKVKPYKRHFKPGRAKRHGVKALRAARRRRYAATAGFATLAAAEMGGWGLARGLGAAATAAGIVLIGAGVAARRSAK